MKIWQWTIWTSLVSLFLLNQYIERVLHIRIPFLYSYFDDLLAVPVTLGAYQLIVVDLFHKKEFRISLPVILVCVAGFVFHFEFLMPYLSDKYIHDMSDVFMYIVGAVFYTLIFSDFITIKTSGTKTYGS